MAKKIFILILLIISLYSCGFAPINNNYSNLDYNIIIDKTEGDTTTNNAVKAKLEAFNLNDFDNKLIVNLKSEYQKVSVGKDAKGNTSDYRLSINCVFFLQISGKKKELSINKHFIMKKLNQNFQQQQYENEIRNNLTQLIVDELIFEINLFLK